MVEDIKRGTKVEILTKDKRKVIGLVSEVGIKKDHSKGLMVVLKTGEIGRIVKIIGEKIKTETENLIKIGERIDIEFKTEALWSITYKNQDIDKSKSYDLRTFKQKASKVIIAKSISALMNTDGGTLVIGVREDKEKSDYEIVGIEKDLEKLKNIDKDYSLDGYRRIVIDEIIRPYFPSKIYNFLDKYFIIGFEEVDGKNVCLVKVAKSDTKVFLNLEGRKLFMIRTDTETRQINDEELVDYCVKRFRE